MSCGMEMECGTAASDGAFCEFCLEEMEFFADPVCERCGVPVAFAREADESNPGDNKNLSQNRPQKGGQHILLRRLRKMSQFPTVLG